MKPYSPFIPIISKGKLTLTLGLHDATGRRHGGALVLSLLLLLMVGIMSGTLLLIQLRRGRVKLDYMNKIAAYYGAEGALNYAVEQVWDGFLQANGGSPASLTNFRQYLDSNSVLDIKPDSWVAVPSNSLQLTGGAAASVSVLRTDEPTRTELRFRSSVTVLSHTETLESVYRIEGEPFEGFEFGLLSNNVSCIFCHTKIDSVNKFDGGPYERVRVASLESMLIRTDCDSTIAGTLYVMNKLMDKSGTVLADLSSTTLQGYTFTDGMIDPSSTTLISPTPAPLGSDGNPLPGYNLYMSYPTTPANQSDGSVPQDFPSVFLDSNLNRLVDDAEFAQVSGIAGGSVSGFGYVIPKSSSFGGTSLAISNPVSGQGLIDGNLILTGTASSPIRIDGKLAVDGDVVIKGTVQGSGSIIARGNIYIAGDLTYNDEVSGGKRLYGTAADGTTNRLALAAGGNVLVGDYLTPKGGSLTSDTSIMTGNSANGFGFTISQLSIFNRREWQKTQPTLPGPGGIAVTNSTYDPAYKPKYYQIDPSSPVWVFKNSKTVWDAVNQTWIGSEHPSTFTDMISITPGAGATTTILNPSTSWITAKQLKDFWIEDNANRPYGSDFKVDALLYTDSSIYTMARTGSNTLGQLILNGALVARDVGVLAAGGLEINYDVRVKELMNIRDTAKVTMVRTVMVRKSPTFTTYY
ncbi:MAG: polymer-forming cytoskeletal protein [Planctomycetes bacterium]|nr:polymer-forming cytoskeletal protein [Planctomycetota bacterium]